MSKRRRPGASSTLKKDFWRNKSLEEFTPEEWEALCDGCGKCCLLKLEDEDTGQVAYTNIACRLLDSDTCRCGSYEIRFQIVPQCMRMTPEMVRREKEWIPRSCAYRILAEGRELEAWHPLISGDPQSVHRAGVSVRGETVPEYEVSEDEFEDYIVEDEA